MSTGVLGDIMNTTLDTHHFDNDCIEDDERDKDAHHRAGLAIGGVLMLAFASLGMWLDLMPTFRLEPLDLLPAVIGLQVVGAVVLAVWLLWAPA
jgi:hypothetical protein